MTKKTVVIHQPDFMPYLGFFQRLLYADLYVILDNVQFVNNCKDSWHRRDKIKTPKGEQWFTVGIQKASLKTNICDILINKNDNWKIKHLNLINENYKKAPFYNEIFPYIKELYSFECDNLVEFNMKSIHMLFDLFAIKIKEVFASTLETTGKSNELLVDILQKVGADRYLSGVGAKAYFDSAPYDEAGIEVVWQDFIHPVYPQLFGPFVPYLSSIDLLFNCGIEESRKILRSC